MSDSPRYEAKIVAITGFPVQRVLLEVDAPNYSFAPGQYLQIIGADDLHIPMSIASAPHRLPHLELHYRATTGTAEATAMDCLLTQGQLTITDAEGAVQPGALDQPLLIIAGGSGAAQAFACAEHRAHATKAAPTTVLWCADQQQDLYNQDTLGAWCQLITKVDDRRTPENEGLAWLAQHATNYASAHIILAGSPGFVYAATDVLLARGIRQDQLQADAYAYAPRN